jgi:chorismate synthase
MSGNTFGKLFRITTFGESHGEGLGVVVDGCPAGFELDINQIKLELARRRPGQSRLVSPRKEEDSVEILSGLFEGKTTGAPLMAIVFNKDVKSKDYAAIKDLFRPGHADFTYFAKYGHRDYRGGGRSSARETIGRVIGGAIAKQLLALTGVSIVGGVVQVGDIKVNKYLWDEVEKNEIRSTDPDKVEAMTKLIEDVRRERDSIGGVVEVQAFGVPPGWGEPVFEKLDALIASAMMGIPAAKGVEIGSGFAASLARGSENNDPMTPQGFSKNDHGGILGGISSGAPIIARVAIKPTSSIPKEQDTIDVNFAPQKISTLGRHDPCLVIRAVPIAEAMLALVLVDSWMQDAAKRGVLSNLVSQVKF